MVICKYRTYSLYSGDTCIDSWPELDKMVQYWFEYTQLNPWMRGDVAPYQIREAVAFAPKGGQLLIGHFDASFVPPGSSIKRHPRGYMLIWKEIEIEENV